MLNIMQIEQYRDLYTNYLKIKPKNNIFEFTYKAGDKDVASRTDQRNYRKIATGD